MDKALRILSVIGALPLAIIGLRWIFDPSGAAEGLQMTLLEGAARNSQIGDTTSFFVGMSGFALYGMTPTKTEHLGGPQMEEDADEGFKPDHEVELGNEGDAHAASLWLVKHWLYP